MRDLLGGAMLGKIEPNVQNLWEGLPLPEPPPARHVGREHGPKRVQLIFDRVATKKTPGQFRTRVIQDGVHPSQ